MLIIRDNLQTVLPATQIDGNRGMYIHVPVDQFRQPLSRDITGLIFHITRSC
jgi:DNA-binding cell septation regulator SpoVG